MKPLKCVMLVEDDDTVNFYNEFLLKEKGIGDEIVIARNGQEALDYLLACNTDDSKRVPDLIFLDINMPVMNGFEFIEEYEKIESQLPQSVLVVMLTTSLHQEDMEKAEQFSSISEYLYKPLMEDKLTDIVGKYFAA